ncbi:MAG: tetratricopeptide repeat-containing glycosyltransferase family protein [Rhizomicrobium sp.]
MSGFDIASAQFRKAIEQHGLGRFTEAVALYDSVIRLNPKAAPAYSNRGLALAALGRADEAIQSYDRAIKLKPDYAEAYNNRGIALRAAQRLNEALRNFERAVTVKPDYAEAYNNLGVVLQDLWRQEDALRSYDRAIALKPDYAEAYNNRGNALQYLQRPQEAIQSFDRAIALNPRAADAYGNKGLTLQDMGRLDDALRCFDSAIAIDPQGAEAHWNKGLCALLTQNFTDGWPLYEWRKKRRGQTVYPKYSQPEWMGEEPLRGKTLLIHAEQGLGDTIQFCRYALLAEAEGAKVILAVQDGLTRLMKSLSPTIEVASLESAPSATDYHVALLSLPFAFRTRADTNPAPVPYLMPEPERLEKWANSIGREGFKVGISWQGSKHTQVDIGRSFALKQLEPLSKIPDVRLISLQKNDGGEQLNDLSTGLRVETLGSDFDADPDAFIDTAAAMQSLDLVVTSDTAVAHLAGALGRPVWVALKYMPDWRWFLDRSDSPWYPTMTLFRQSSYGDWSGVFSAMEARLRQETSRPR